MHVGVFLPPSSAQCCMAGLPHARGGVSFIFMAFVWLILSSPCTWGCFHERKKQNPAFRVFPMHVGVFLAPVLASCHQSSLPHARGGVSKISVLLRRARGVFPMHVGVFLTVLPVLRVLRGLPHARGGVSAIIKQIPNVL